MEMYENVIFSRIELALESRVVHVIAAISRTPPLFRRYTLCNWFFLAFRFTEFTRITENPLLKFVNYHRMQQTLNIN